MDSGFAHSELAVLPTIPARLRVAAAQGTLIPFVGAGASRIGGCPDWDGFATEALRTFVRSGKINHSQIEQLRTLGARTRLSIAVGLEREHNQQIDFGDLLRSIHGQGTEEGRRLYAALGRLGRTFLTTNYDAWLDFVVDSAPQADQSQDDYSVSEAVLRRNVHFKAEDFTDRILSTPNTVIHLHGSVEDRASMLLTTSQYLERYANHRMGSSGIEENSYLNFLAHVFKTRSLVFVGYGLAELEVLEYVMQKGLRARSTRAESEEPRHYVLQGFFSHQAELMRSLRVYYLNEFNVGLLPFSLDARGWSELVSVVEYLADELPGRSPLPLAERAAMQELLT